MMRPVVVSDAGPLIALAGCGQLELLVAVFGDIHIPQAVLDETTADQSRRGAADIAAFGRRHATVHANRSDAIYKAAVSHLDEGEAQALSLAHALGCGLLMDERRGRQEAQRQGYRYLACSVSCCRQSVWEKFRPLRPPSVGVCQQ